VLGGVFKWLVFPLKIKRINDKANKWHAEREVGRWGFDGSLLDDDTLCVSLQRQLHN